MRTCSQGFPSGVKPTPRAEALWPEVRTALGHLRAALSPGEFNPQTDAASFRIAMADATAALFMPPLVSQIEQTRTLANVRVLPLATRDPSEMLARGDADLAIGYFPETISALTGQGSDSPLRQARLHDSEYVCVMREGHPLAEPGALTLDAFCDRRPPARQLRRPPAWPRRPGAAGAEPQAPRRVDGEPVLHRRRVVANSNLLTVLPGYFVEATGYHEQVVTRPLPFDLDGLHVAMVWHQRNDRNSAHQWLRARLLEAAAQHAANG